MEELVRYIISAVLDSNDFEITMDESKPKATIITVTASEDNVGKIIGRGGKTISSIRTILRTASAKTGKRYIVKIGERD